MHFRLPWAVASAVLLAATTVGFAHHSVAMYDTQNLTTVKGAVTKVEWTSPHVFIYLETKDDDGKSVEWAVELDSPVLLRRYGWVKNTVSVGDEITCSGAPAKSGAKVMRGTMIELADGSKLRVWSRV
jgi:Family of unknown function (DUF6152)